MIDSFCRHIVHALKVNKFIETGTYQGATVSEMCIWFYDVWGKQFGHIDRLIFDGEKGPNPWNTLLHYPVFSSVGTNSNIKIYSIDKDSVRQSRIKGIFITNSNVDIRHGSSNLVLKDMIDTNEITEKDVTLFYLDAHWETYWPLKDEIKQVLRLSKSIIVIDDFFVPGHEEWGYVAPGGDICGWNYIKECFIGKDVSVYYPVRSNVDNRGWCIIFVGYTEKERQFLTKLPVRETIQ